MKCLTFKAYKERLRGSKRSIRFNGEIEVLNPNSIIAYSYKNHLKEFQSI